MKEENIRICEEEEKNIEKKVQMMAIKVAIITNIIFLGCVIVVCRILEFEWKLIFITLILLVVVECIAYVGTIKAFSSL